MWAGVGVLVVLIAAGAWIGYRGLQARDQLTRAEPLASRIETSIAAGDRSAAVSESQQLSAYAGRALALTSDPIWRVAQYLPLIGPDLTAVHDAAQSTDTVATRVVAPIARAASGLNIESFKPVGGAVDLTPLEKLRPVLVRAQAGTELAAAQIDRAPTAGTLAPVGSAVGTLRSTVHRVQGLLTSLNRAAELVPAMLGADGPRNYLLLFLNPAELRATGGITGSLALVHTDGGKISLASQVAGDALGNFSTPVAPLPQVVESLFSARPAQYIEDVNLTPDYPLAASLAASMWKARYGTSVDGVIALDPVVLGYLLKATGPIPIADGLTLTSSNAVSLLLSRAYQLFPQNTQQDAFFSATAAAVFERISSGDVDPYALIRALVEGGSQRRIDVWSSHASDQRLLAGTTLAGAIPVSTPRKAALGVYLNDGTGAKLDYYLHVSASAASRVCSSNGDPDSFVTVTLTNGAPADAATSLPEYVTNVGRSGVPAGTVITEVGAYGPEGGLLVSTTTSGVRSGAASGAGTGGSGSRAASGSGSGGGSAMTTHPEVYGGRPLSQFTVTLAPGQSQTVTVRFRDPKQRSTATSLTLTPGLHTRVARATTPECASH